MVNTILFDSVSYIPIITSTSGLPDSAKGQLHKIMDDIDGIITDSWEKFCTHLTVLKPKLTEKVYNTFFSFLDIFCLNFYFILYDTFNIYTYVLGSCIISSWYTNC